MKYSFPAFENGFIRAAAASPALRVADCTYNAEQIIGVMREYAAKNVQLLCLPEFALTGYTCSDLFLQDTLLCGAEEALAAILEASKGLNIVVLVGLPVRHNGKLYNCAAVLCNGELLGLVPKTHLPNYGEFYEKRHFIPGMHEPECITLAGQETLLGTNLLFACKQLPAFVLAAEVCEDLWAPIPPSCAHALAGATVVANLSASDETVGKAAYRRELVCGQSARLLCAYLYADAGHGESTTDMTFAGHNLIAENGSLLADAAPFAGEDAVTELDLGRMVQERQRNTTFMPETSGYTRVEFELPPVQLALTRPVSRTPFVPQDAATRAERCELILRIQAEGLAKRMEHTHAKCGVLGISGVSSDFRDLEEGAEKGNERCALAREKFAYEVKKLIGAYAAVMGGVDAIIFTAGVGENDALERMQIASGLEYMGVKMDEKANDVRGKEAVISASDSKVKVLLIPTNEELMIAMDTASLVG